MSRFDDCSFAARIALVGLVQLQTLFGLCKIIEFRDFAVLDPNYNYIILSSIN